MAAMPPVAALRCTTVRRTPAGSGSRFRLAERRSADPVRRLVIAALSNGCFGDRRAEVRTGHEGSVKGYRRAKNYRSVGLVATNDLANAVAKRFDLLRIQRLPRSGRPGSNRRRPGCEAGITPLNYARETRAIVD